MAFTVGKKRRVSEEGTKIPSRRTKKAKSNGRLVYDSGSSSAAEEAINASAGGVVHQAKSQVLGPKASSKGGRRSMESSKSSDSEVSTASTDSVSDIGSAASSEGESSTHGVSQGKKRKRNDPDVFATSISKILNSKLSTSKRSDPVLARSKVAIAASQELSEAKLEAKARHKLRDEKKAALDRGRVKDVLGVEGENGERSAAEVREFEKRLKKTAQRGVVKLFNAVRAAQVKGEQAAREAKKAGVIGVKSTEDKVNEMSKQGFLELIAAGGAKGMTARPREA